MQDTVQQVVMDSVKGFYKVNENSVRFKAMMVVDKEGSLDDLLSLLTTNMPKLWGLPETLTLGCVPLWGHPTWETARKKC